MGDLVDTVEEQQEDRLDTGGLGEERAGDRGWWRGVQLFRKQGE